MSNERLSSLSRRDFTRGALAASVATWFGLPAQGAGNLESIEHRGVLIRECSVQGETRKDDVFPSHPNGIQVSRNRWLLVYTTRGFRGVDDDRSIAFQLRGGSPDGPLIREGLLVRTQDNWDPLGQGKTYVKNHSHAVAFGVPRGATILGKPAPHANVFVVKWYRVARILDRERKALGSGMKSALEERRTRGVEWVQFRLNDREDDIEILQPVSDLRQKGYERGDRLCSEASAVTMYQTFTPAVPYNRECTEWVDCNSFSGRVAALKYAFNLKTLRYEWVQTGPLLSDAQRELAEASIARVGSRWVLAVRDFRASGFAWAVAEDPFQGFSRPFTPSEPSPNGPVSAFTSADGVLRLFTGDPTLSPYKLGRDPLYCWEIDPAGNFACSNRRVIFDSVKAGLPFRRASAPTVDMCKMLRHYGKTQFILHRVRVRSLNYPYIGRAGLNPDIPIINEEEKANCAIYYAKATYSNVLPLPWDFPPQPPAAERQ